MIVEIVPHEKAVEIATEMPDRHQKHLESACVVIGVHPKLGSIVVHVAHFGESYLVRHQ